LGATEVVKPWSLMAVLASVSTTHKFTLTLVDVTF
jgi:hypothetical protein